MAIKGHSCAFEVGDASTYAATNTWTSLGTVTVVTPPEPEAEDIDVGHMNSTDQYDEFLPGWAAAGEPELQIHYAKANQATIFNLFRTPKGFRVVYFDGGTWKFDGYIKKIGDSVERKGIITTTVTMKVTGVPAFAQSS